MEPVLFYEDYSLEIYIKHFRFCACFYTMEVSQCNKYWKRIDITQTFNSIDLTRYTNRRVWDNWEHSSQSAGCCRVSVQKGPSSLPVLVVAFLAKTNECLCYHIVWWQPPLLCSLIQKRCNANRSLIMHRNFNVFNALPVAEKLLWSWIKQFFTLKNVWTYIFLSRLST